MYDLFLTSISLYGRNETGIDLNANSHTMCQLREAVKIVNLDMQLDFVDSLEISLPHAATSASGPIDLKMKLSKAHCKSLRDGVLRSIVGTCTTCGESESIAAELEGQLWESRTIVAALTNRLHHSEQLVLVLLNRKLDSDSYSDSDSDSESCSIPDLVYCGSASVEASEATSLNSSWIERTPENIEAIEAITNMVENALGPNGMAKAVVAAAAKEVNADDDNARLLFEIEAAKAVAETIRTTLGPRGMEKLVYDGRDLRSAAVAKVEVPVSSLSLHSVHF